MYHKVPYLRTIKAFRPQKQKCATGESVGFRDEIEIEGLNYHQFLQLSKVRESLKISLHFYPPTISLLKAGQMIQRVNI